MEEKNIICPLSLCSTRCGPVYCKREECAWYDKFKDKCCLLVLAESVNDLAEGHRTMYIREV